MSLKCHLFHIFYLSGEKGIKIISCEVREKTARKELYLHLE